MKVKAYVSGTITETDKTEKKVLVAEREDGERLETVVLPSGATDEVLRSLAVTLSLKPKVAEKVVELDVKD